MAGIPGQAGRGRGGTLTLQGKEQPMTSGSLLTSHFPSARALPSICGSVHPRLPFDDFYDPAR